MRASEIGIGIAYLALAAAIIAANWREIRTVYGDAYAWWLDRHPRGVLWDDVDDALTAADRSDNAD